MTAGSPVKLILGFALPVLAGNMLQQLYSLVDSLIIGRLLGVTALTAVSAAALTIYDMCKAVQRDIVIDQIRLMEKSGGKSGHFVRQE